MCGSEASTDREDIGATAAQAARDFAVGAVDVPDVLHDLCGDDDVEVSSANGICSRSTFVTPLPRSDPFSRPGW